MGVILFALGFCVGWIVCGKRLLSSFSDLEHSYCSVIESHEDLNRSASECISVKDDLINAQNNLLDHYRQAFDNTDALSKVRQN